MATYESEHERYWRGVGNAESTGLKATVRGLEKEIENLEAEVAAGRMWREVAFEARRDLKAEAAAGRAWRTVATDLAAEHDCLPECCLNFARWHKAEVAVLGAL